MKGQPVLPARRQHRQAARLHEGKEQAPLQDRLRDLRKLQPDILSAVSADTVLQAAAAADPQLAQLLDPGMVSSVLQLLQEGTSDTTQLRPDQQDTLKVLSSNRKALAQLQSYAVQLQAARQGRAQAPHSTSNGSGIPGLDTTTSSSSGQGVATNGQPQGAMWDQLQQRLQKYQQRDVTLQARLVGLGLAPKKLQANSTQQEVPTAPPVAAASSSRAERPSAAGSGGEQDACPQGAPGDVLAVMPPEGISRIATSRQSSRLPSVSLPQPSTPTSPFAAAQPAPASRPTPSRLSGAAGAPPATSAGRARAPAAAPLVPLPVAAGVPDLTLALPMGPAAAACGIQLGASPTAAGAAAAAVAAAAAGASAVPGPPGGLGPSSSVQPWPAAAAAAASAALLSSAVPQAQGTPVHPQQQQQWRHMGSRPTVLVPHSPLPANSWPAVPPPPWAASPRALPGLTSVGSAVGSPLAVSSSTAGRTRVSDGGSGGTAAALGAGAGGRSLRPHSSSPLLLQVPQARGPGCDGPLSAQSSLASGRSNSQAFQRVFSGECIVEIPPPTKLATNLSWTTSPSAGYLIEASSSGLLPDNCLSPTWPGSGSGLPVSAGAFHTASSCGSMTGSLGRGGGSTASLLRVQSIREINEEGLEGGSDEEQGRAGQQQQQKVQHMAPSRVPGNGAACDIGASPTARDARKRGAPAAADKTVAATRARTAAAAASVAAAMHQHRAADAATHPQQQVQDSWNGYHQHHRHTQQQHRVPALDVAQAVAASAGGGAALQGPTSPAVGAGLVPSGGVAAAAWGPRYYYEHVAASSWQPDDGGNCWALYRRAYCSQGEALVPPLWMAAVALLSYCRVPFLLLPLLALAALLLLHRLLVGPMGLRGSAAAAGVLARGVPSFVVSLECVASAVLVTGLLPLTWQGHAGLCTAAVVTAGAVLVLHVRTYLLDPGYLPHTTSGGAAAAGRCSHSSSGSDTGGNGLQGDALPGAKGCGDLLPLVESEGAAVVVRILPAAGPAAGSGPVGDCGNTSSCPGVSTPLSSPCGTGPRQQGASNTSSTTTSASSAWQASPSKTTSRYRGSDRPTAGGSEDSRAGSKQQAAAATHKQLGVGPGWGQEAAAGAAAPGLTTCWTCGVERTLRSKHCPFCNRCVGRMDHHCSVVANCIGAGNQRSFTAYLAALVLGQGLFLATLWAALRGEAAAAAAAAAQAAAGGLLAGAMTTGSGSILGGPVPQGQAGGVAAEGGVTAWRVVALGAAHHPGWLLLGLFMVVSSIAAWVLLLRQLANIAANLTTNEWVNRGRYIYLQHDSGGYANRFDRGPLHNCWAFWAAPQGASAEGWAEWEAGEKVMRASGLPYTTPWAAGRLIRRWDAAWATWRERLRASRQRRAEAALQRRLRALGLGEGAR